MSRNGSPIVPDEYGDYDSPSLRDLRDVWNRFLESGATEEEVLDTIRETRVNVDRHIDQLQAQVDMNTSDPNSPLFRSVARSFVDHLEALSLMEKEFEVCPDDPDYDDFFERGYLMAQEATNRMMEAHEKAMIRIEKAGWTACTACGARNLVTNRECHTCRTILPKVLEMVSLRGRQTFVAEEITTSTASEGQVTQNFLVVKGVVDQWLRGELKLASVLRTVAQVRESLTVHLEENGRMLGSIAGETSKDQAVRAALIKTEEAVSAFLESLGRLTRALSEPDPKTPVVRVRMVELEKRSGQVAESYYLLKQAYEAAD